MTKEVLYQYMGTNGIIVSPVHLEDIYYVRKMRLRPDKGNVLTKDGGLTIHFCVEVPEEDIPLWKEIEYTGQN